MPITDSRIRPLCSCRVYDPGMGDPVVLDRGFRWPDILAHTFRAPNVSFDASGQPTLQLLSDGEHVAGLVQRPLLTLKNASLVNYTASGGSWGTVTPAIGSPNVSRIVQYDTSPNLAWALTSKFNLPANPQVAFELLIPPSPSDHDATTYPPFVRIEFGNGGWAIQFSKLLGAQLLQKVGGGWQAVDDLPEPVSVGGHDLEGAFLVLLRCYRGRIWISTDFGKSYKSFGSVDGSAVSAPASSFTLRGIGSMVVFGFHQVVLAAGTYTAPGQDTGQIRFTGATLTARYTANGGSITLTDLGDGASRRAQYSVTLTPATTAGAPFTFYSGPEVYSVLLKYPVVRSLPSGSYTTPWDGRILEATVTKPLELDGATATIHVRRFVSDGQFTGNYRWRKVELLMGDLKDDGSVAWYTVLTGEIADVKVSQTGANIQDLTVSIDNGTARAKRVRWDRWTEPMGGVTVNQFLDACLDYLGLDASYRNWHPLGNLISLPYGSPEDPGFWPKEDEPVWGKMSEVVRRCGMEIGVDNNGVYTTVLLNYVDAEVTATWDGNPMDEVKRSIQGLTFGVDYREAATRVCASGTDEWGNEIRSEGVDLLAEQVPAFGSFCPWRETVSIREEGTVTQGWLNLVVQSEMTQIRPKFEADLSGQARLDTYRRQRGKVTGTVLGVADVDEFACMTLTHEYRSTMAKCRTVAGLRRLT